MVHEAQCCLEPLAQSRVGVVVVLFFSVELDIAVSVSDELRGRHLKQTEEHQIDVDERSPIQSWADLQPP